ncbi:hypothetical protein D0C16_22870 [Cellvibrio sp. KY-GH-1]|uniref:hypothetical protein n=1 Tax=Cellvibrio sp. KY-GH-1 TaxID=2303332 RepID=UPI001246F384|nr:hypothetical protein [Cellvibrio sp. KY-GH-1]QEY18574.1 hypothetical protein D0C16_22870 [Cellvibrio sp. KY-GH-1]
MNIDVDSFSQSVASLDADLLELNNEEKLESAVYVAAFNLHRNGGVDLDDLVSLLRRAELGCDNNEFALLLAKTTNVDWLYDEGTEKMLKFVIEKLLEGIEYYSHNDQ